MYDRLSGLEILVDGYDLSRNVRDTSSGFTRVTTTISLSGDGAVGRGEDVSYEATDHDTFQKAYADGGLDLAGEYTFGEFSSLLEDRTLFSTPPARPDAVHYRRWGFESAALDLALRQAGTDLASLLDRSAEPIRFLVSTRLEGVERLDEIRGLYPGCEFKLDPTDGWDAGLVDAIAERGGVRVLDLKGHYEGTEVDGTPEPSLYRLVAESFPDALLEDPAITDATRPVIETVRDRVSWDAPITGVESIEALPFEPAWINVKPSRFGTVESLLATIAYCESRDIAMYGGGQFELDVGRGGIQQLASLFYPDGPNDVAPAGYNDTDLEAGLPRSPLEPPTGCVGFGW